MYTLEVTLVKSHLDKKNGGLFLYAHKNSCKFVYLRIKDCKQHVALMILKFEYFVEKPEMYVPT